ncbi:MAG: glycosyltransferase family 2 protein [Clostridia bacterium]|nr:glycosyltransferase family 2 protein [Clostridia bacterium]
MKVSVVVPCYNEELSVERFYNEATAVFSGQAFDYELIFVDDGSSDNTFLKLGELAKADAKVKVLSFSRNFGQQAAIICGFRASTGDAVVEMDCDLQDPVEVVLEMVKRFEEGFEVVHGRRLSRKGESRFKKSTAKAYYKFLNKITTSKIPQNTGDFKLLSRRVCDIICELSEKGKYLRGLESWVGFKQTFVDFERHARQEGETKYTLKKMVRLAKDGVISFSEWPLTLSIKFGIGFLALSVVAAIVLAVLNICGVYTHPLYYLFPFNGLIGGLLMVFKGISDMYLHKTYEQVKDRPEYVIDKKINL